MYQYVFAIYEKKPFWGILEEPRVYTCVCMERSSPVPPVLNQRNQRYFVFFDGSTIDERSEEDGTTSFERSENESIKGYMLRLSWALAKDESKRN